MIQVLIVLHLQSKNGGVMDNKKINIRFSDYFSGQIVGRSSIDMVLKEIKNKGDYILDFENIDFISRSAVHQLLSLRNELKRKGVKIFFENVSNSVEPMIERVTNSMTNPKKNTPTLNLLEFKDEDELENYLNSL